MALEGLGRGRTGRGGRRGVVRDAAFRVQAPGRQREMTGRRGQMCGAGVAAACAGLGCRGALRLALPCPHPLVCASPGLLALPTHHASRL